MSRIAAGDWVIFSHGSFSFANGEVLFVNKHFVVVRNGDMAFDVARCIKFVGNRKQVVELMTEIGRLLKMQHEVVVAAEKRVTEVKVKYELAILALFKPKAKPRKVKT